MSNACTPIMVGVDSPVSEILLLSKTAKFPFLTMNYSPWSPKNLIVRNCLKKFMQVGIARTLILVGVDSPVSEILVLSKMTKFPFLTMDYSPWRGPWSSKNLIDRNWLKKFMQVGIDVKCMYINFGGCGLYGFGDTGTLKNGQISLSNHGL